MPVPWIESLQSWRNLILSDSWFSRLEKKITRISDQDYTPGFFSFEQLLVMASGVYRFGSELRLSLYRSGVLKSRRLPCFVISIGNIMAGGVGKTPMAICIAELLIKMGKRPVVISRGYKGRLESEVGIVGDGEKIFLDAKTAGDEPYMMARRKTFPVVVGRDRYAAGKFAIEQLDANVIVLDDGFAHVSLERDLNILLFDHDRPLGNKRMLPAGRLRETPAMSKNRAHAIVFTRCPEKKRSKDQDGVDQKNRVGQKTILSQCGHLPFFKTCHTPYLSQMLFRQKKIKTVLPCPDSLKDRHGLLFSGIANNKSFRKTAVELGVKVVDYLEFKDHYMYTRADILLIKKRARDIGTDLIVTTEKDWVKLGDDIGWDTDLAVVGIKIRFENEKVFERFIESRLNQ
ncbi:MAG: tetraacyldisaccharide 4'-kinase [Desulfobacteraceae bacterium]|nr:tetraacyldisaccharide 4'-kinase [Desulfobacteraceae bacterium]